MLDKIFNIFNILLSKSDNELIMLPFIFLLVSFLLNLTFRLVRGSF